MKTAATCFLSIVLLVGCGHTHTTEKPAADDGENQTPPSDRHGSHKAPVAHPAKTPVVESPEALLAPGGEDEIRKKLVAGGYLEDADAKSLEGGLRKFQSAKDLPVTGIADHETVRRLGLDPNKIFRHADPPR
ncbi:MAG TPA: peptidoglycan-binding domain-containing protein [Polyangia bacterium]